MSTNSRKSRRPNKADLKAVPAPGTPKVKRLRGRYKEALIIDLADGALGHEDLADKHGISKQGVAEFAKRNRATINQLKEAVGEELIGPVGRKPATKSP
jgi:hypothetical protein